MRIMIAGNMGYVGPALVRHLRSEHKDWWLEGLDNGYFAHCLTSGELPEHLLDVQHFSDLRSFKPEIFSNIDALVLLAAISNDPIGNNFESVTNDINFQASLNLAKAAKKAGVKNVVFASSCSVYGTGDSGICSEESSLNPLTAYARSKLDLENALKQLSGDSLQVTCLRFATACGFSDRLRLDLVLNDFVASAIATGKIVVLSDGSPWRPLIHVKDMSRAIDWALQRKDGGNFLAINAGSNEWNYQIKDLAKAVAEGLGNVEVNINTSAQPDKRSYRVDFSKFESLASGYTPQVTLKEAIRDLLEGMKRMDFSDADFRQSQLIRLHVLNKHIETGKLDNQLSWKKQAGAKS